MAQNFKISIHRSSDSLHLKLIGDFDDRSAHELIDAMKKFSYNVQKVFIHTNCMKSVHPFGRDTFQNSLDRPRFQSIKIHFTGNHAKQISPDTTMCI